ARIGADREIIGRRRTAAVWELERANARAPVEAAAGLQVLVGVPEGAVVHRVHRHRAVVAPAMEVTRLRAHPGLQRRLALRHLPKGVTCQPSGVADSWAYRTAGDAIAKGDIARLIHGDAAHPAVVGVGRVRPLLEDRRRAVGTAQLVPAHAHAGASSDRVIDYQRFMPISEVTVG